MPSFLETVRRKLFRRRLYERFQPVTPLPGRSGLAVVAIVRNEASYLAEWLEFHLMVGAVHIYLYDNGSTDASPEVTRAYCEAGAVTVVNWPSLSGKSPQLSAYADAITRFGASWRWMAFIDVDEFLYPAEGDTLTAVLDSRYRDLTALEVNWRNFGSSGHVRRPPGLVTAAYTMRGAGPRCETRKVANVKSIVDPAAVKGIESAHRFQLARGEQLRLPLEQEAIRLNHYFTRSREEFEIKMGIGCVFWGGNLDVREKHLNRRVLMARAIEDSPVPDTGILPLTAELERRLAARLAARDAAQARA